MTLPDSTRASADTETLTALEEVYAQVKRVQRDLRPTDRIIQDLEIDSLATLEILLALEERFGVALVDNPKAATITTVGDLVGLLDELRADATTT
ncbi:putative acyl carrier protein [Streptomyces himastatinicus ATCC 53653]|uniref:Putative acyl carrier protein n=1 Tax=Streptomyces himastatinicus ATCC 53653 TaxID=457427 RepID=D9WU05_9ACTN|nr:phosphopantetheine-binding protein [Streptomyces himastatinicus]EFL22253.1 putative acyl carrier protein [Streptomyces himastatinicus ATCC 53653]